MYLVGMFSHVSKSMHIGKQSPAPKGKIKSTRFSRNGFVGAACDESQISLMFVACKYLINLSFRAPIRSHIGLQVE